MPKVGLPGKDIEWLADDGSVILLLFSAYLLFGYLIPLSIWPFYVTYFVLHYVKCNQNLRRMKSYVQLLQLGFDIVRIRTCQS